MDEYEVMIGGLPHTVLLTKEDADRLGVKARTPTNKSRAPKNKKAEKKGKKE